MFVIKSTHSAHYLNKENEWSPERDKGQRFETEMIAKEYAKQHCSEDVVAIPV